MTLPRRAAQELGADSAPAGHCDQEFFQAAPFVLDEAARAQVDRLPTLHPPCRDPANKEQSMRDSLPSSLL